MNATCAQARWGLCWNLLDQSCSPPSLAVFVPAYYDGEVLGIRKDPAVFGRRSASPPAWRENS